MRWAPYILLHVWGSLGSATLALLQQCTGTTLLRFLSYATMLDGLRFIVVQQCNQQHCYARNNKTGVSMVMRSVVLGVGLICRESGLEIVRVQTCLCVGLWTPFGWKPKFVSGNCERNTWVYGVDGEHSRSSGLVNDRLMMDHTPRCRCGVQVDR
jgi:hypothetical protein